MVVGVFGLLAIAENIFEFEIDRSWRYLIAGVPIAALFARRFHQVRRQKSVKMPGDDAT